MLGRFKKAYIIRSGERNRERFQNSVKHLIGKIPAKGIEVDMVSMSGKKYFADQLYSMLSFYYHAGTPVSWTVFDDGTYTEKELKIFSLIPAVSVLQIDTAGYEAQTKKYPTLKKMMLLRQINPQRPTIFTDSDVLFYPQFFQLIKPYLPGNAYLVDEKDCYFDDFIPADTDRTNPLNLGVMLINRKPNWNIAFDYIDRRIKDDALAYWTDQTAVHLMVKAEKFSALHKDVFVTGGKDAFTINDAVDYKKIALRHFVGPIRHKMWQHDPEKMLQAL